VREHSDVVGWGGLRTLCSDCGKELGGASLCGRCGAVAKEGVWVCFECGAQNPSAQSQCRCGRDRRIECGSCAEEIPFSSERCPRCGVPRFAFEAVEEARRRALEIERARVGARNLALALAPVGAAGAVLSLRAGSPLVVAAGGGLIALALGGTAWAFAMERQARRRLE
jgi:hypothetical protein